MTTQEIIIYRLVVRNHDFDALKNYIQVGEEMGHQGIRGPQDPTKKLAQWVDLLGQPFTVISKTCFQNFCV